MKKELFKKWYKEYGRELAIETCPYDYKEMEDDVWEKELRRKAKKIFSSVYNMYRNELVDSFKLVQKDAMNSLYKIKQDYQQTTKIRNKAEKELEQYRELATELYNLHKTKEIKEEYFESLKTLFGERIATLKSHISDTEKILKGIKKDKKNMEHLVLSK